MLILMKTDLANIEDNIVSNLLSRDILTLRRGEGNIICVNA